MVVKNKRVGVARESGACLGRLGDGCDPAAVVPWFTPSAGSAARHSDDVDRIRFRSDLVGVVSNDDDCSSFLLILVSSSASSLLKRNSFSASLKQSRQIMASSSKLLLFLLSDCSTGNTWAVDTPNNLLRWRLFGISEQQTTQVFETAILIFALQPDAT